jgi:hypothetical protein
VVLERAMVALLTKLLAGGALVLLTLYEAWETRAV